VSGILDVKMFAFVFFVAPDIPLRPGAKLFIRPQEIVGFKENIFHVYKDPPTGMTRGLVSRINWIESLEVSDSVAINQMNHGRRMQCEKF